MSVITSRQIVMPIRIYTWNKYNAVATTSEYETYPTTTTYSKGTTSYGTVESQDVDAYPDNGYQDGYWYVRV